MQQKLYDSCAKKNYMFQGETSEGLRFQLNFHFNLLDIN